MLLGWNTIVKPGCFVGPQAKWNAQIAALPCHWNDAALLVTTAAPHVPHVHEPRGIEAAVQGD